MLKSFEYFHLKRGSKYFVCWGLFHWFFCTMASSYLILFLTHPTFLIVPCNIYHTKIYCKWTSLLDRAYRAYLRPEKVIHVNNHHTKQSRIRKELPNICKDKKEFQPSGVPQNAVPDVQELILIWMGHYGPTPV